MTQSKQIMAVAMGLLFSCALACGSGDDSGDPTPTPSPTPTATPGPGEVTVNATGITGSDGLALLVFLYPTAGNLGQSVGGICDQLAGDPASLNSTFKERLDMNNPCTLGTAVQVDPGNYTAFFGTYTPGEQIPQECAEATVDVDGDTSFDMPTLTAGACP